MGQETTNPYIGLRPFDEADRNRFFGRAGLTKSILERLEKRRLVALAGVSGAGKTSVVRAGVIPEWRAKHPGGRVALFRPGKDPFAGLAAALRDTGVGTDGLETEAEKPGPGGALIRDLRRLVPVTEPWLLVIDPFEEIFLGDPSRTRDYAHAFAAALAHAVRGAEKSVQVLLVLRDDFLGNLREFPDLAWLADAGLCRVILPTKAEWREMIVAPVRSRGVSFESGLVSAMLDELRAGGEGMLPLLQYTLTWLWESTCEPGLENHREIGLKSYREAGGVRHALALRACQVFEARSRGERRRMRSMLMSLVSFYETTGGGILPVARPVSRLQLVECGGARSGELLKELVDEGFVVKCRDGESMELGHEVLTTAWGEFAAWIAEAGEAIQLGKLLTRDASEWQGARRKWLPWTAYGRLWRGGRLLRAREFLSVPRGMTRYACEFARCPRLGRVEEQFVAAGDRVFRWKALGAWGTVGLVSMLLAVTALVSVAMAWRAVQEMGEARCETKLAQIAVGEGWLARARFAAERGREVESGFLAGVATGFVEAGWKQEEPEEPQDWLDKVCESKVALVRSLASGIRNAEELWPEAEWLLPGRKRKRPLYPALLTAEESPEKYHEARRRMAEAPRPFVWSAPFEASSGPVESVAFHPGGRLVASGNRAGLVTLWDAGAGREARQLTGLSVGVKSLAFDSTGKLLAAASSGGSAKVWEVASGRVVRSFSAEREPASWVAFHPEGTLLLSAGDGRITLGDPETGQPLAVVLCPKGPVRCLALAPGGNGVAKDGPDGSIWLGEVSTARETAKLLGHRNEVCSLCFSPDGKLLVSGDAGGVLRCWDIQSAKERWSREVHAGAVRALACRGDLLVAGLADGTVRLWETAQGRAAGVFSGHRGPVTTVAFAPDASVVASGGEDQTLKFWVLHRSEPFDWHRYIREGWIRWDPKIEELVWEPKAEGLSMMDQNIPGHCWLGILRQTSGLEQARCLFSACLSVKNWESAVLLQGGEGTPVSGFARDLREEAHQASQAGDQALAHLRLRQGDGLFAADPDWALFRAGDCERAGRREEASAWYRRVNDVRGWRGAARLMPGTESMEFWGRVLGSGPENVTPEDYRLAGTQAAALGKEGEARRVFGEGLSRFGEAAKLQVSFGKALSRFGDLPEAKHHLEKGLTLLEKAGDGDPGNVLPEALSELGAVLSRMGRMEEAWATYRRVLVPPRGGSLMAAPGAAKAPVELLTGAMYVGMLLGHPEAEPLFAEAKDRAEGGGERAMVLERRGWGLLAQGRAAEAFEEFGQARAEWEFHAGDSAETADELLAGLAVAAWLTDAKGAALDEYGILVGRAGGKRWLEPKFLEGLAHLPRTGVEAILAIRDAWRERGEAAPEKDDGPP